MLAIALLLASTSPLAACPLAAAILFTVGGTELVDDEAGREVWVTWQGVVDGKGFVVECSGLAADLPRGCIGAIDGIVPAKK